MSIALGSINLTSTENNSLYEIYPSISVMLFSAYSCVCVCVHDFILNFDFELKKAMSNNFTQIPKKNTIEMGEKYFNMITRQGTRTVHFDKIHFN